MKFLNPEGVKTLWNQISLQDYPNNETLNAVINAINATKADKSELDKYLKIEDYIPGSGGGSSGSQQITTEYAYTYDGDVDNGEWVLNGSGHKMYVKMGDIPKGTINIVGSHVLVTNPKNSSLNVLFEVTEEHLTRELSMYDGTMVAVAQ